MKTSSQTYPSALVWFVVLLSLGGLKEAAAQSISTNTVTGTISVPGERDTYTFSLTERARYYFDALTNSSSINWSLEGPTGLLVNNRGFSSSDAGNSSLLSLVPGFYRLTINASGGLTPDYSFRFVNLAVAALLTPGTVVSNTLSPANETDFYQFTSAAGDQLSFDRLTPLPSGNVWWRLIDPYGNEVFSTPFNDVNNITQRVAGAYTLLVEGYPGNIAAGPYSFSVVPQGNTPPTPFAGTPLTMGSIVSGSLTNASTNSFTFSLATGRRLVFDTLTNNSNVRLFLEGPPGLVVNNITMNNADGQNSVPILELPPGDYQLRIGRASAGTEPYRFRLHDAATATPITPGTPILSTLSPATETDLYRFNASAGAQFYFDAESTNATGGNAEWRLFDPLNGVVTQGTIRTDRGPITLV